MIRISSLQGFPQAIAGDPHLSPGRALPDAIRRNSRCALSTPLANPLARFGKRAFDIVGATLLLVFLSPLMFVAALNVRRDGGPALYRQRRLGLGRRPFICLKFRSMHTDPESLLASLLASDPDAAAEWEPTQKLRCDPRVTTIGHFIRTTSIDELPQRLNVLRGEMSLIGPRLIVDVELQHYGRHRDLQLMAKPGLTGLWQVSGRSDTTYQRRVQLDIDCIKNWTFRGDIAILFMTLPVILLRRGAV